MSGYIWRENEAAPERLQIHTTLDELEIKIDGTPATPEQRAELEKVIRGDK